MIKNFDEVKRQLIELSDAVNRFKSESVQLRIVELVLGAGGHKDDTQTADGETARQPASQRPRRKSKKPAGSSASTVGDPSTDKKKRPGKTGTGARGLFNKFIEEGWFKQRRRIGAIVEHCATRGKKLRANEISGKLLALVREERLHRAKDAEGQWEYFVK